MTQQSTTRRPASRVRKAPRTRAPMQPVAAVPDGDESTPHKMILKPEVLRRVGCTYPTIWRWMIEGTFPLSFDVGGKTGWRESEIDHWFATRPRSNLRKNESA